MAGESVIEENGRIADVGKALDRQAVSDNAEVLAPLLEHFGTLTSDLIQSK